MPTPPLNRDLDQFLQPYTPAIVAIAHATRWLVVHEAPDATELVYDAYNAVAMGYTFTARPSDAFCHIAVYSGWVNLGFNHGAELPDPKGLLQGTGTRVRHIRLSYLDDLSRPFVRAFLRAAIKRAIRPELAAGKNPVAPRSIVRAVYPKKRRPKSTG